MHAVLSLSNKYVGVIICNKIFELLIMFPTYHRTSISNCLMVIKCEITRLNEDENTYFSSR